LSLRLLERSRDLRVLGHLALARLHLAGFEDYAAALSLTRDLLDSQWATIHPQLDAEDDNDPTMRANALLRLAHPGLVLKQLRAMPLAGSPRMGQFSWRDVALATGALPSAEGDDHPSEQTIRAAFQDSNPARLTALRAAAVSAAEAASGIPTVFDERAGYGTGPDFEDLGKLLKDLVRTIDRYAILPAEGAEDPAAEPAAEDIVDGSAPDALDAALAPTRRTAAMSAAALTEVTTRADALRLMDLATQYFQRHEPSSPMPLLIERARRLADKNFLDVLRELAPDGLNQAQTILGLNDQ
jgi:type VI secretion system protein ImpA